LIGPKGTGRTWSWFFLTVQCYFVKAVHNKDKLPCFIYNFKVAAHNSAEY